VSIYQICVTLWDKAAEDLDDSNYPVIAIKRARVKDIKGKRTLSFIHSSILKKNPDIPEANKYIISMLYTDTISYS